MKEKTLSQDLGLRILNRKLLSNLPMKEKVPFGYRTNLDHGQVAQRFAVQNLTLPPSMPVEKVTEYVYYLVV